MKVNKKTRKSGVESRNQGKEKRKYQQIKSRKKDMWLKTKKKKRKLQRTPNSIASPVVQ